MPHPVRIGTSGWNYRHWKGIFYPDDLPQKEWFQHYCRQFDTVEINNTFYHQPRDSTFDRWRKQAPTNFLYAVKANRYLTHTRKLNNPGEPLERFFSGARRLKKHLGPLLFQLPPNWRKNLDRLEEFCRLLPRKTRGAVEFRNRDWLAEDTYALLRRFNVALCVHDMLPRHPRRVTASLVYVRFHGSGQTAGGKYSPSRLRGWADWIRDLAHQHEVFAYFNNDAHGYALDDARTLRELVG